MARRAQLMVALLFALGLAMGAATLLGRTSAPVRVVPVASGEGPVVRVAPHPEIPPGHGPFVDGREVTLAQAQSLAAFTLHRPDDPLASDSSIVTVWLGTVPEAQVAIEYSSGVEVRIDQWNLSDTPSVVFGRLASQFAAQAGTDPSAYLESIQGSPALLIPMNYQGQGNEGSVQFVLGDGVRVWVYGNLDASTLNRIAAAVR